MRLPDAEDMLTILPWPADDQVAALSLEQEPQSFSCNWRHNDEANNYLERGLAYTGTLTVEGGWNADFTEHNPISYPTIIDAQDLGRIFTFDGQGSVITPTLRDIELINSFAGNEKIGPGLGGALYAYDAVPRLLGVTISASVADTGTLGDRGRGGGAYIHSAGPGTLISGCVFLNNTGRTIFEAAPGGLREAVFTCRVRAR
ncbi:MAG TPA: hypothetical protein EYP04_01935 [Anaerolineae bacterium]|nr:hypothetical protein [Anaerolineae bacterium]HIQ06351.1 hypothetical protein [Anaerolineae bacterium]